MLTYSTIFISFGFFGWLIDTGYRSLRAKRYAPGTWVPFFSLIFATAAILLYILFTFLPVSLYADIIRGTIVSILLELIAGLLALKLLNRRFWDYSNSRFNYRGIIDVHHSFYWLILTALYRLAYPYLF